MSATPLRDKLVQLKGAAYEAATRSGKGYSEAMYEASLAVKQYEEQALARLALYPELVKALAHLEADWRLLWPVAVSESLKEAQAILAQAEAIDSPDTKEAKG